MAEDHHQTRGPTADAQRGGLLVAISTRIVALYKQLYGKGPTRARTCYQDDVILVLMHGGFTPVERTLHRAGRDAAVAAQRAEFQEAVKGRFVAAIEELVGRRVQAFMSSSSAQPELSAEIFVLEPSDSER
ncbi:MAG TPA: Na-translocating system protein MpsC family protein [Solirubrobacteraceae bacterium]|nr:Na-translocating system protein MpsC family protein [Solirubrobacteraceae bacterium]